MVRFRWISGNVGMGLLDADASERMFHAVEIGEVAGVVSNGVPDTPVRA
jgi:hypothetical protein